MATPRQVEDSRPTDLLHRGDEPLSLGILADLGLEPDDLLEQPGRTAHPLTPLLQDSAEALSTGNRRTRCPVHSHVPVALQQAHQTLELAHGLELVGSGQ